MFYFIDIIVSYRPGNTATVLTLISMGFAQNWEPLINNVIFQMPFTRKKDGYNKFPANYSFSSSSLYAASSISELI